MSDCLATQALDGWLDNVSPKGKTKLLSITLRKTSTTLPFALKLDLAPDDLMLMRLVALTFDCMNRGRRGHKDLWLKPEQVIVGRGLLQVKLTHERAGELVRRLWFLDSSKLRDNVLPVEESRSSGVLQASVATPYQLETENTESERDMSIVGSSSLRVR